MAKSGQVHQTTILEDSQEATMFSQSNIGKLRKLFNQFENQTLIQFQFLVLVPWLNQRL